MINKMCELNRELVLDELSSNWLLFEIDSMPLTHCCLSLDFDRSKGGEIPVILDKYLESIAQNGDTLYVIISDRIAG